jgi:heavy metal sensor kinase
LQNIVYDLLLVTPLVLILSALGSYWLAGRAFRSIHQLAYTAREIGAKDLDQRVPVPEARDEVQELALIFNQMIGRLEKAFAQQRRFVADASHELRTPVAAIRSMTEVALSQLTESEDYVNVLREVNAEAERLGRLTNDLLALARADEGQVQFDSDAVRLDLLAADAVESLEPLANERNITLSTETLQPATVRGDAARLIQVIIGLVDNALTYTNAGGFVRVSVEAQGTTAQLIVHDTGIGIAQEDLGHIFERFYRADPARSRSAGGCGLGLAIVDWVVRAHNGTVTVESQVGKGSTFTVTLPLEKDS